MGGYAQETEVTRTETAKEAAEVPVAVEEVPAEIEEVPVAVEKKKKVKKDGVVYHVCFTCRKGIVSTDF